MQKMAEKVLSGYESFMELLLTHCRQLHTLSIPLPTISDDNDWGEVTNLPKNIKVLKKKTVMTLAINTQIARLCTRKNIEPSFIISMTSFKYFLAVIAHSDAQSKNID